MTQPAQPDSVKTIGSQKSEAAKASGNGKPRAVQSATRRHNEMQRKRRYVQKRRQEMETLRRLVKELTLKVDLVIKERASQTMHRGALDPVCALNREERHVVEHEQEKLKAALDRQLLYLETLRSQFVLERMGDQWVGLTHETWVALVSSRHLNRQAHHVGCAEQLRQIFVAYAQVDKVFQEIDISQTCDGIDEKTRNESVQHIHKWTLPFRYVQTRAFWWKVTNVNHALHERDGYVANLAERNNTVLLRLRLVQTQRTGTALSILQRYALCRFVEANQTVFVWKTYSEGEGTYRGLSCEETGWARLRPSADPESTDVVVCVTQAPILRGASRARPRHERAFYSVLRKLLQDNAPVSVVWASSTTELCMKR
ncbi:hypothetical protein PsorP6_014998 [Peronosclerospora sorghi]|uniref:Uncharacterized protein n=1 Tax=Peronosclerospora sorghi TaxID=230839 RepID=A0ACC0VU29_9STRA|nr:hypothetical protein PsorP6_014998 [Peronosclerospora sorghi]